MVVFLNVYAVVVWLHVAWSSDANCAVLHFAELQTGVKVTNVNDLQDIDELCVVEVGASLQWSPADFSTAVNS
jgi:hypothetical protein